jgi:AcrR family transcriptional regulator
VSAVRSRMTAEKRRECIVDSALKVFAAGSYRGVTTAEIARACGVSEPILYRHFDSKRELYLGCVDEAWTRLREMWQEAVANEPDPSRWLAAMGRSYLEAKESKALIIELWVQALDESSEDPAIRKYLKKHLREVHGFVVDVIRRAQSADGMLPARDPHAEAWIFISLGLLVTMGRRLGGLLDDDWPKIFTSRREWMTGRRD